MKKVIINADDFGLNDSCTQAIAQAFKENLITDTTIIANGEAFGEAINIITSQKLQEKVGIHFNLTEGIPLTKEIAEYSNFVEGGVFHGKINRLRPLRKAEKKAIYQELTAQIEKVENEGIIVTHADSHHHIHTGIFIAPIIIQVCKEHNIKKIRLHRNIGNIQWYKKMIKNGYNFWIKKNGFVTTEFFGTLEDSRIELNNYTEIMVHPDFDENKVLIDRTGIINGIPVGNELSDVKIVPNIQLISYRSL